MDAREQAAEINKLRLAIYNGLREHGGLAHPRELNLALLSIAVQVLQSRGICEHHVKESINDMVEWVLSNTTVLSNKEIN